ncbi:MAG: hypothetical protein WAX89_02940 [Alphaproteobacteria bacterium]
MRLVPDDFVVPERLEFPNFVVRKLCHHDAALDFAAVMSSRALIQRTRGNAGAWPEATMTLEENAFIFTNHGFVK